MNYEFILTDSCNRKCKFCYVKQNNFFAKKSDVDIFYNKIFYDLKNKNDFFEVTLFGGEPLLNFDVLDYCIEKFYNENCQINIVTNGDLISKLENYRFKDRVFISISAYDIFKDLEKYRNISKKFKNCAFNYTFTDIDIDRFLEFKNICEKLNVLNKPTFSHSVSSWYKYSDNEFYNLVYKIYENEFETEFNYFKENDFLKFSICLRYIQRFLEYKLSPFCEEIFCIDSNKVFYNGKFIGPCIRCLYGEIKLNNEFRKNICKDCPYKKFCFKSCVAEYKNGKIPKKICYLEKAPIDAMFDFFKKYKNNVFLNRFLNSFL